MDIELVHAPSIIDLTSFDWFTVGPCVGMDPDTSSDTKYTKYSAIYSSANQPDHQLLIVNEVVGVCTDGTKIPNPFLHCSKTYYECLTDDDTNLQYWQTQKCSESEVFNRIHNRCMTQCKL